MKKVKPTTMLRNQQQQPENLKSLSVVQHSNSIWAYLILKLNWTATYIQQKRLEGQLEFLKPHPILLCAQHGKYMDTGIQHIPGKVQTQSYISEEFSQWMSSPRTQKRFLCPTAPMQAHWQHSAAEQRAWQLPLKHSASHNINGIKHSLNECFPECHSPYTHYMNAYTSVHVLYAFAKTRKFWASKKGGKKGVDLRKRKWNTKRFSTQWQITVCKRQLLWQQSINLARME